MRADWRKAIIEGDGALAGSLLEEGVDIDCRDKYGQTGLMLAAKHGQDEILRLLLKNGADMDVTAKYGLSALMLAVVNHRSEIAKQLIDAGANTQLVGSGAPGFAGKTAHALAEHGGQSELADYLARSEKAAPGSE